MGWVVMQLISCCHLQDETCQSQPSVFLQLLLIIRFAIRLTFVIVAAMLQFERQIFYVDLMIVVNFFFT